MLHLLCGEMFNYLVDDGGCIYLVMIAEEIGRDCWLTAFDVALCLFKAIFERRPGFSAASFPCHFLMSLAKSVERVMMMSPMLISWVGVSAELAASAMFAYSLIVVKTLVMGLP
jgi:hypothetical protein